MTYHIEWDGIPITVEIEENIAGTKIDGVRIRAKVPLPVTKTGYRSHYISHETLAQFENHIDFVLLWLDEWAKDPAWIKAKEASRQLSLF